MEDDTGTPKLEFRELDFSQFHPLDHWPSSPRCWGLYGSPWNHIVMTWQFRRREQVVGFFRRLIGSCRRGRHAYRIWYTQAADRYTAQCVYCSNQRPATQAETDGFRHPAGFRRRDDRDPGT